MIVRRLSVAALLAMIASGCAATGQQPEGDRKALLVATIEKHGCAMTNEQADTILPPLNFTFDETKRIVDELINEGRATVDGTTLTLKTENCR